MPTFSPYEALAFQSSRTRTEATTTKRIYYYRPVGSSSLSRLRLPSRQARSGTFGDALFSRLKASADATALRVLAYTTSMVRTAANGFNVLTVDITSSTPGVYDGADYFNGADSTPAIQAIFDRALEPGVDQLVVNWKVRVKTKGIAYHDNTYVNANFTNAGMYLVSGNGNLDNNGVRPNFYNANVSFTAGVYGNRNFVLDGGEWNGSAAFQRANSPSYGWMGIVRAYGVIGLVVKNCKQLASSTFTNHLINTRYVYLANRLVDSSIGNTDGDHLNGYAEDVLIENNDLTCGDDHIGVNAGDALDFDMSPGNGQSGSTYYNALADINNSGMRNIVIRNNRFGTSQLGSNGGACGLRLLPAGAKFFEKIWIENLSGVTNKYWGTMTYFGESQPGRTVPAGNCVATDIGFYNINVRVANPAGIQMLVTCDTDNIGLWNVTRNDFEQCNQPSFGLVGSGTTRVPHHTNVVYNSYQAHDISATTGTNYTNNHFIKGLDVVVSGVLECRDWVVLREGADAATSLLEANNLVTSKVDFSGLRVQGVVEPLLFKSNSQITSLLVADTVQVGGTSLVSIKDSGSSITTITANSTYQGPLILKSLSSTPTTIN